MDYLVRTKCLCHNLRLELESRIVCFVHMGTGEADSIEVYLLIFVPQPITWHKIIIIIALTY